MKSEYPVLPPIIRQIDLIPYLINPKKKIYTRNAIKGNTFITCNNQTNKKHDMKFLWYLQNRVKSLSQFYEVTLSN